MEVVACSFCPNHGFEVSKLKTKHAISLMPDRGGSNKEWSEIALSDVYVLKLKKEIALLNSSLISPLQSIS